MSNGASAPASDLYVTRPVGLYCRYNRVSLDETVSRSTPPIQRSPGLRSVTPRAILRWSCFIVVNTYILRFGEKPAITLLNVNLMNRINVYSFSVCFLLIVNFLLPPIATASKEFDAKSGLTEGVYGVEWHVSSYSLSDELTREPNTSFAAISFYEKVYFEVGYYCGAVRGIFTVSSGTLVTKDAVILDEEMECASGGQRNPELNKLLQSTFLNTTTMIKVEDGKLIVSTEANETITFVQ